MLKFLQLSGLIKRPSQSKPPGGLKLALGVYRTSVQWRSDPAAVEAATRVLREDPMKEILAILHQESPMRLVMVPGGASQTDVILAYGVEAGYQAALRRLESLAEPLSTREIEPTFPTEL